MTTTSEDLRPFELARRSIAGDLPLRYQRKLEYGFHQRIDAAMEPGMRILDVGSGRLPCRTPELTPSDCHYVGLDSSAAESAAAKSGSYDECASEAPLENTFDRTVS